MKTSSRKPTSSMFAILTTVIVGILARTDTTFADISSDSCSAEQGGSSVTCSDIVDSTVKKGVDLEQQDQVPSSTSRNDYAQNCRIWPASGVPLEHLDTSCDRAAQNAAIAALHAAASSCPEEELIRPEVYLNLPEERSWVCPLDDASSDGVGVDAASGENWNDLREGGGLGHPTKWILYNEASTPILVTHVNALGLEVSATDFKTYPAHVNNAVYPHGPIVLPGQMAVVEGRQGHLFVAREFKEDVLSLSGLDGNVGDGEAGEGGDVVDMETMKNILPSTWSFSTRQTRYRHGYHGKKEVMRVLGNPGRVLLKHRMGMIYVKNEFGAMCPEMWGKKEEDVNEDEDHVRTGNPTDPNPDCNALRKGFINKVGCPVDLYFAPPNRDPSSTYSCEKFTKHLGALQSFSPTKPTDLDTYDSPLKFEQTYNSHRFVARMSHDQSLVARIELDHDVVRDCPEPRRTSAISEIEVAETVLHSVPVVSGLEEVLSSNASTASALIIRSVRSVRISKSWLANKSNHSKFVEDRHGDGEDRNYIIWQNRTAVLSVPALMTS